MKKLIEKADKFAILIISKNQSRQTDFMNQQISNLSSQLILILGNQQKCSMNFQNLEKSVSEHKSLVDQMKSVFHEKFAKIADHQKHIDLLRLNPMMAVRTVGPFFKLMEKDCILPE